MQEIIDLLEQNARLTPAEIAAMIGKTEQEVAACIADLEQQGIILKYTAVINHEKLKQDASVSAIIEIQVIPVREHGFDALAERIYRFPQVTTVQLMSGGYDLLVEVTGKTLKEVALFVSERLATLEGVKGTRTHFVLKTYKENGTYYIDPKKDFRENITA
ncbi:MAG: Lrp/AsnC family transcriptional regulator [Treponema sp.]